MINDTSTGYWDYSNEIAPQWMEYGSPGAAPKPGTIAVGGGNAAPVGAGGSPIGGANPIFSVGPPNPNPNPNPNPTQQFTPTPFMTPGMTFQPRTQFGQQASAPLNLSQQGRTYGQTPGGPNMAQQTPAFQSVRPGGSSGFMPQFRNPYGPQPQQPPGEEVGIGDFMRDQLRNIYGPQSQMPEPNSMAGLQAKYGMAPGGGNPAFAATMEQRFPDPYMRQMAQQQQQPQQYRQMGQQPTQISQQPLQQTGLPSLLREYRPGDNLVMSSNGVRIS
jgi:hypothetical protein